MKRHLKPSHRAFYSEKKGPYLGAFKKTSGRMASSPDGADRMGGGGGEKNKKIRKRRSRGKKEEEEEEEEEERRRRWLVWY